MECLEWFVPPLPQLVTVGYTVWKPGMRHFSRNFGLYDVILVRSGCIFMAENGREYEVRAGHILTLEPGKTHVGYRESEEDTELFWIHIKHESARSRIPVEQIPWSLVLRKGTDSDPDPAMRPMYMPKFGYLGLDAAWPVLEEMMRLHDSLSVGSVLKLQAEFARLLAGLQESVGRANPESPSSRLASAVAAYLRRFERAPFGAEMLEREFHYNPDYISRCLKRHTGMSPLEYVRHIRMERAKRLLAQSPELTVKQIAELVCMPDPNYFSRMFRKETGVSPAEYRKRRIGYS
ncbi:AraC family transcriptional regulator [Paenibacillus sp. GYB003]|uniref:AraC family transcriptional regulator n=1 Tax=Paenibacillus sp. GYB003 TaxID=2994392 RepID=UPI002F9671E5